MRQEPINRLLSVDNTPDNDPLRPRLHTADPSWTTW